MTRRFSLSVLVLLAVVTVSCDLLKEKKPVVHRKKAPIAASAAPSSSNSTAPRDAHAPPASSAHGEGTPGERNKFALPFAWELGENEPLAKTKGFVREMLRDNRDYMKHGPKFFEAFAKAQKPRVTVVTCSDSRVQSAAWDNTPENDNFTIRNIGNLLTTSHGSVEYGVEHLNTSVLLIVGHTGCGAIKAAMGDKAGLSAPIRSEIDAIVVPKELQGDSSDSAWTAAVIANVHDQVRHGLEAFASFVNEGRLTIVGAVFDFRNDLGKGPGRLTIVDVNGNSEKERLDAFVSAVSGSEGAPSNKPTNETTESAAPSPATGASLEAITKQLEKLGEQESKKPVNR